MSSFFSPEQRAAELQKQFKDIRLPEILEICRQCRTDAEAIRELQRSADAWKGPAKPKKPREVRDPRRPKRTGPKPPRDDKSVDKDRPHPPPAPKPIVKFASPSSATWADLKFRDATELDSPPKRPRPLKSPPPRAAPAPSISTPPTEDAAPRAEKAASPAQPPPPIEKVPSPSGLPIEEDFNPLAPPAESTLYFPKSLQAIAPAPARFGTFAGPISRAPRPPPPPVAVSDAKDFEVPPPPSPPPQPSHPPQPSADGQWDPSLFVPVMLPGYPYPVPWPAPRPGQTFSEVEAAWQAMGWAPSQRPPPATDAAPRPPTIPYFPAGFRPPGPEFQPGAAPYPIPHGYPIPPGYPLPPGYAFPPAAQTPPT